VLSEHPIYLTVDIDVLDPSAAPGTGCPEPGGATYGELEAFLHGLAEMRVVAVDVVEVAPALDPSEITAAAAAKIVRDAVLLFGAGE
jgi:arginase family enzyme